MATVSLPIRREIMSPDLTNRFSIFLVPFFQVFFYRFHGLPQRFPVAFEFQLVAWRQAGDGVAELGYQGIDGPFVLLPDVGRGYHLPLESQESLGPAELAGGGCFTLLEQEDAAQGRRGLHVSAEPSEHGNALHSQPAVITA